MTEFRYKAFISYSHKNSRWASWLMKKLEGYRLPDHLNYDNAAETSHPRALGKFFRDREELSATHCLDSKITEAIGSSEYLIVVCSPDSALSPLVDAEIREFMRVRNDSNILCFIVAGEPRFDPIETDQDGCIPPSIVQLYQESRNMPLAADARGLGDGKHRALSKLVAGLVQIDLDDLLQREQRRRQRRLVFATATAVAFSILTTGLMLRAIWAEKSAQQAKTEAQQQHARAEDLIGFMIDDLVRSKLVQLGRVDVIDAVVEKVVDHYQQQPDESLTPSALGRKARAYMQLGRMYLNRNEQQPASELFEHAAATTRELVRKQPDSDEALFNHIRGLYWMGYNHIMAGQYKMAADAWSERLAYGKILIARENLSKVMLSELGDMHIHLGWSLLELGRVEEAQEMMQEGLARRSATADRFSEELRWQNGVAGGMHHFAWSQQFSDDLGKMLSTARQSNAIYEKLAEVDTTDQRALGNLARSHRWLAEAEIAFGEFEAARANLEQSLRMFPRLLQFEPENASFQYQSCMSAITLAELMVRAGESKPVQALIETHCPAQATILAPRHFKVHQRILGYRLSVIRIELDMMAGNLDDALARWHQTRGYVYENTEEVLQSIYGKQLRLMLAMAAVRLHELTGKLPSGQEMLVSTISQLQMGSQHPHPNLARLLTQAAAIDAALQAQAGPSEQP